MATLFNSATVLTGTAPWAVGDFELESGTSFAITAYGLVEGDLVCVQQLRKVQAGNASAELKNCGIDFPDDETASHVQQLLDCGVKVAICAKQPWVKLSSIRFPAGQYRLSVSGPSFINATAVIDGEVDLHAGTGSIAACAICTTP